MTTRQRIVRVRRDYNQWVANQTLEDYSLRFTAKSARRWSSARVANTALGAISFLALEAIGGTVTLNYGFANAALAILLVGVLIFGAGFGYIGSTITSLIYASFTFIFFAIEAVILASVLEALLGLPPWLGYIICAIVVIPLVTHGITFISRFQRWSQPVWLVLQILPFPFIAFADKGAFAGWMRFSGAGGAQFPHFDMLAFGAAASVVFALVAQIGEQVDFLRFLPVEPRERRLHWWTALLAAGPGWIIVGMLKLLAGSFLAYVAFNVGVPELVAAQPTEMYRVAFGYVLHNGGAALALAALFVAVSQVKINVTNAYAGSIAWSNFFSRLTHSHPGRVVWLVFNVAIALLLMELGIYEAIERILSLYALVAAAWMGALVADLVINKPLGLSPPMIEFKRAHLYDINPVGVGSMVLAALVAILAHSDLLGSVLHAFSPFLAFFIPFLAAPLIAVATRGRFYLARKPRAHWARASQLSCVICEHAFEPEDMAFCPVYSGAICSLCCSLDARCADACKPRLRVGARLLEGIAARLPPAFAPALNSALWRFLATFALYVGMVGLILGAIFLQSAIDVPLGRAVIAASLWKAFGVLLPILGVAAWLTVLARRSRIVAQEETRRQTALLMQEIRAHERTDRELQKAKEAAESANLAKSRYVVGLSHELRTPLNAILGYAQLLERDKTMPERRQGAIRLMRRGGEHMAGLIDGLLDIAKIEAGSIEIHRDRVRLPEFLDQIVAMFRPLAESKGIGFVFDRPDWLPGIVHTDEMRLRQIFINLLSNAVKFTTTGEVRLRVRWRSPIAEFEVADTGPGIAEEDLPRIFEPFRRVGAQTAPGVGLGLTITQLLTQIMGGDIAVTSTPGQGSQFRLRVMLSESAQASTNSEEVADISGYAGNRRSIMVVDDDPAQRSLIEDLLTPLGFAVIAANDGASCLELVRIRPPDLLLLDLAMPGMDGWELARQLRAEGHTALPIVIVSANAAELRQNHSAERLHDGEITKPVSVPALLGCIGNLLRIDWLNTIAPESPAPAMAALLTPRHIADLRQLAAIGYVRGIQARLDELARELPDSAEYIAHLRGLINEFRLADFASALDRAEGKANAA